MTNPTATITRNPDTTIQFVARLSCGEIVGFSADENALGAALVADFNVKTTTGALLGMRDGEIVRVETPAHSIRAIRKAGRWIGFAVLSPTGEIVAKFRGEQNAARDAVRRDSEWNG